MRKDILEAKDQILQWISEERTKSEMAMLLHCKVETLSVYLKKMGINYSGQQHRKGQQKGPNKYIPAVVYIQSSKPIKSHVLKEKLIKDGLKDNECEICGACIWQNKLLPLELHHKDGDHFNNSLDNLQILCPNCHSIQDGNSGASIGKYEINKPIKIKPTP